MMVPEYLWAQCLQVALFAAKLVYEGTGYIQQYVFGGSRKTVGPDPAGP